jgi:hypothetical protein
MLRLQEDAAYLTTRGHGHGARITSAESLTFGIRSSR